MWTYLLEIIVFSIWYFYACMDGDIKKANIKVVFQPVNMLVITLVATGMCLFVNFQLSILNTVLPETLIQEYTNMIEGAGYGIRWIPTLICLILAPIGEEFMFRGVLFYYLLYFFRQRMGKRGAFWLANLIQALLFGIFHMNWIQGGYAFVIGLVLGYLVYQYGSILPAIIVHAINNFLSAFVWGLLVETLPDGNGVYAIGAGLSLCVVVLGMILSIINSENIANT